MSLIYRGTAFDTQFTDGCKRLKFRYKEKTRHQKKNNKKCKASVKLFHISSYVCDSRGFVRIHDVAAYTGVVFAGNSRGVSKTDTEPEQTDRSGFYTTCPVNHYVLCPTSFCYSHVAMLRLIGKHVQ